MTTKLEAIRALNDELRQNLTIGTAFITVGVAPSALKPSLASLKPSPCTMISATPTIHTRNTILGRLRSMARRYFSRSIISTRRSLLTRQTQLIRRSRSVSSPSCWLKSTEGRHSAARRHRFHVRLGRGDQITEFLICLRVGPNCQRHFDHDFCWPRKMASCR